MTVRLDGTGLTVEQVVAVARDGVRVELTDGALERIRAGRAVVEQVLADGRPVYGLTTGVGVRRRVAVPAADAVAYNRQLIADHRVATGPAAADDVVRAAMLRLANSFCTGTPGVRPELAALVVDALNAGRTPRVRMLGSAGQGDLAPMADLAVGLLHGFEPAAREGHALLNTGAFSTGLAALALHDAERLLDAATVCGALDLEAFAANPSPLAEVVGRVRPYPGLVRALADLRASLEGSAIWSATPRNLQDPLSFRNVAAILGAARDAAGYGRAQVAVELNASQENPIVDIAGGRMLSVANYELLPLSQALDVVRLGLAPVITSANERLIKLLQAPLTGLTDGLQPPGTTHHNGLSELAWAGQALAPEARLLTLPVSAEIASSTQAEAIEDRISLAPLSARRLREMIDLGERLLAIGLVVACQAVDLRGWQPLGEATGRAHAMVRELVPALAPDGAVAPDLDEVRALVGSGALRP
jgi:histidine ammonia-lyase